MGYTIKFHARGYQQERETLFFTFPTHSRLSFDLLDELRPQPLQVDPPFIVWNPAVFRRWENKLTVFPLEHW